MKKLILPLFALFFIWTACNKTELTPTQQNQELMWSMSDSDTSEVVKEFNSTNSSITVEMIDISLCHYDVLLSIDIEGASIFEKKIDSFPFLQTFAISPNSNIKIKTELNDNGALVLCNLASVVDIKVNF